MTPDVVCRLLELNRSFYAAAGAAFHATRKPLPEGMVRAALLPTEPAGRALRVLDAGCGNGRLARALEHRRAPVEYVGVDGDAHLLAFAQEATSGLQHVQAGFVQADLALDGWASVLNGQQYDAVFCLATLHHFPGEPLRQRIVRDLAGCLAQGGCLILATWQFEQSDRLRRRIVAWESIGMTAADVDPGDALLPWDQGLHALRYVHAIEEPELRRLAAGAGLVVSSIFSSDGRAGNLNLYAALVVQEPLPRDH